MSRTTKTPDTLLVHQELRSNLYYFDFCEFTFADLNRHAVFWGYLGVRVGNFLAVNRYSRLRAHTLCLAACFDEFAGKQKLLYQYRL
jgi:hypothetical protein